jgi:CRISPR-associated exonuclease Cas4
MHLTGNLINAYFICPRKFWLYARQFNPDPEAELLMLGRIISEESYRREKKEYVLDGIKIDFIRRKENEIIICEVKKSSTGIKAAIMQVSFYLKKLRDKGITAIGEILIPKEKRKIPLELTKDLEEELDKSISEMKTIMANDTPPKPMKNSFCKNCAFYELCFA